MSLVHICRAYTFLLAPIPLFSWLGASVNTLDVLGMVRLCAAMRQLRDANRHNHDSHGKLEERSFVKDYSATITVVYGGEALSAAWLGQSPSFLLSGTFPLLYLITQYFIESLPWMPAISFETEGPLTLLDALARSYLLTNLIPPSVLRHPLPTIANSPWTLLLVSSVTANGGFFFVNLFSMLHPGGMSVVTPSELKTYGWTTVDLWAAPLITGLVALLTHAQPFWASLHVTLLRRSRFMDAHTLEGDAVKPWSVEDARALAAVALWVLFVIRTINNFGIAWWKTRARPKKKEVMRSNGRRHPGVSKTKKAQ